jgi:copper chaperone
MEKAYFKVVGMYCISCKSVVEKQLKNESGIKGIDLDYMTNSVIIEFDPSIITIEEIKDRLERSGYNFVRTAHLSLKCSLSIHICWGSDQTEFYIVQNIDRFSVHLLLICAVPSFHQPSYCIQDPFVPYNV